MAKLFASMDGMAEVWQHPLVPRELSIVEAFEPPTCTVKGPGGDIEIVGEVPEHLPCADGVKCRDCNEVGCPVNTAVPEYALSTGKACLGHLITAMVKAKWDEVRELYKWDMRENRVTRIEFMGSDGWETVIESAGVYNSVIFTSEGVEKDTEVSP